jgi:hypothetical protein
MEFAIGTDGGDNIDTNPFLSGTTVGADNIPANS